MNIGARLALAVAGTLIYATAGGLMGAENAGWITSGRVSNDLLPVLGVGAALVALAFVGTTFSLDVGAAGALGRASKILIVVGCLLFISGAILDFAIFGTLSLAAGLFCLTATVLRARLASSVDRVLIGVSAVGSITWNTETSSALLLVGVGLIWLVLSFRLLRLPERADR